MTDNDDTASDTKRLGNAVSGKSREGEPAHHGDQAFRNRNPRERWREMTYAGALSFMRCPYSRDLNGIDAVVCGVPYDGATSNRPGARLGPRAIRAASTELGSGGSFPFGSSTLQQLVTVDYGDFFLEPQYPDRVASEIAAQAQEVLSSGARMLALGGDHFISYPLLQAHAARHGALALIQFDAHSDTWPDDERRLDHGTMFLRAVRDGVVDARKSIQIGIRSQNEHDHGFESLTAPWIHRSGVQATIRAIFDRIGSAAAYLTFDIDVLDPAFAPGTGTPVAGGLASWQALEILRGLGGLNMVGADVVEVSPPFDHAEITALAGATVAHDLLCLWAASMPVAKAT